MIKANKKMDDILKKKTPCNVVCIEQLCMRIVSKTKCINNCILYDNTGTLDNKTINWDFVLKVNFDFTGYEVCQNEIKILDDIFSQDAMHLFLINLNKQLKTKFPNRKFCFILTYSDVGILRFHTYRSNEGMWISSNLESYQEPILYALDNSENT